MLFKATLFFLPLLAHASALPGADVETLEKRDTIYPTLYENVNKGGRSFTITISTDGQCYSLKGKFLDNNVSSIKIPDGYRCRFWSSYHCNGASTADIQAPGSDNIGGLHNEASSIKCYNS